MTHREWHFDLHLPPRDGFHKTPNRDENDGIDQNQNGIIDDYTNGLDDNGIGGVDDLTEVEGPTPYPVPLKGIQIRIRTFDPDSRQIREVTVTEDFLYD